MANLAASDFNNLKARVKAEMLRRNQNGTVAAYGAVAYDYVTPPATGGKIIEEHHDKLMQPLEAVKTTGDTAKAVGSIVLSLDVLTTVLTSHESKAMIDGGTHGCGASCTGLCTNACTTGCSGCTGCTNACTGCTGCSSCSGCSDTCSGGCSSCSGCSGGCTSACTSCNGCSGCTDACTSACTSCTGSCNNTCSGTCTGGACSDPCTSSCSSACTGCFDACTGPM